MHDATGKIPDGTLQANLSPRGAFHECLDIESPKHLNYKNDTIEGYMYVLNQKLISFKYA